MLLTRHSSDPTLVRSGVLQKNGATKVSGRVSKSFDVRKGKPDPEARSLSGGNLQKFVIGRELDRKPGILVVNQPTWGVDAGASATILTPACIATRRRPSTMLCQPSSR